MYSGVFQIQLVLTYYEVEYKQNKKMSSDVADAFKRRQATATISCAQLTARKLLLSVFKSRVSAYLIHNLKLQINHSETIPLSPAKRYQICT